MDITDASNADPNHAGLNHVGMSHAGLNHAGLNHAGAPDAAAQARRTMPSAGSSTFTTPVRGHAFAAGPRSIELSRGTSAMLQREPWNPADPFAIAVWVGSSEALRWRIGYLDQVVAARLAPRMDAGEELEGYVDGWLPEPEGRWSRPAVRIRARTARFHASRHDVAGDPRASPSGFSHTGDDGRQRVWGRQPGVRRRVVRAAEPR